MTLVKLKHVNKWTDRHGRVHIYFRRPGCKAIPLPGPIGSPAFMQAYNDAVAVTATPTKAGTGTARAGTFAALAISYLNSARFDEKRPETQRTERRIVERLASRFGPGPVSELSRDHIQKMIDERAGTPSAARNMLAVMRTLMVHARDINLRKDNPAIGVTRPKIKGKGFRAWTDDDATKYEATHSLGTRARIAYELLSCTGLRRSDVVRIGRQHVRQLPQPVSIGPCRVTHELHIMQEKTGEPVDLLILPQLQAAIDALPADNLSFIVSNDGKPLTKESFGNWFHECCLKAGLSPLVCDASGRPKGLSAHGLRKRMGARLADLGCSERQIAAVLGHTDLRQVRKYTEGANRRRMSHDAMLTLLDREQPRTSGLQTQGADLQTAPQANEKKGR